MYVCNTAASLQIASLKEQLTHCKSELRQHSALVKTLQKELEAARDEALAQCATGERLTGEMGAYKEVLKERDLERTQLKADIMTLETKLKASQEECVRKEKDAQRQFRSMENNFGEQLRAMNQTRDKCKEFERSCSQLEMVRGTLERRVTALAEENEQLQARLDAAERKEMELMRQRNEAEGRVKEGEAELKSRVTQLQQEVAHRAQQVGGSQIRVWGVWCCHSGWGRGICTVHMALCTYTPTYMGLEGEAALHTRKDAILQICTIHISMYSMYVCIV